MASGIMPYAVGSDVMCRWPGSDVWFQGQILAYNEETQQYSVVYGDGTQYDLQDDDILSVRSFGLRSHSSRSRSRSQSPGHSSTSSPVTHVSRQRKFHSPGRPASKLKKTYSPSRNKTGIFQEGMQGGYGVGIQKEEESSRNVPDPSVQESDSLHLKPATQEEDVDHTTYQKEEPFIGTSVGSSVGSAKAVPLVDINPEQEPRDEGDKKTRVNIYHLKDRLPTNLTSRTSSNQHPGNPGALDVHSRSHITPRTQEREFGGLLGAIILPVALLFTMLTLLILCQSPSCSILEPPDLPSMAQLWNTRIFLIYIGWVVFQTALYALPLGKVTPHNYSTEIVY